MIEQVFFHVLGVICVIGIFIASRIAMKTIRAEKTSSIIMATLLGLLGFVAAYGILIYMYTMIDSSSLYSVYDNISITGRLYIIFFISSVITLFVSSAVGYFFKKYCNPIILIAIAFILNLLISLQPSGYIWVTRLSELL